MPDERCQYHLRERAGLEAPDPPTDAGGTDGVVRLICLQHKIWYKQKCSTANNSYNQFVFKEIKTKIFIRYLNKKGTNRSKVSAFPQNLTSFTTFQGLGTRYTMTVADDGQTVWNSTEPSTDLGAWLRGIF